jgi:hypothetical protein
MKIKAILLGFLVIDLKYVTWSYIKAVLCGQKKLIKKDQVVLKEIPPK